MNQQTQDMTIGGKLFFYTSFQWSIAIRPDYSSIDINYSNCLSNSARAIMPIRLYMASKRSFAESFASCETLGLAMVLLHYQDLEKIAVRR